MSQQAARDWGVLVNSVRTPLGFFALVALILDGILIAAAATTDRVSIWAPLGVLALLVGVFAAMLIKPQALYHPNDWPEGARTITLAILFDSPIDVELDPDNSKLATKDKRGRTKYKGPPNLTFGYGGWVARLDQDDLDPSDSVRLDLLEVGGERWAVGPLMPYETEARAKRVNT